LDAPRPLLPVIVGPTGVGKTALVLALAEHWPVTVVSADSRQIYRGLDIGTGKPTAVERARVPHLGVDLVGPGERYSAGQYVRDAAGWLRELTGQRTAVVVGGTGLYARALSRGLFHEPPLPVDRRERLRAWTSGVDRLSHWAARLDPEYAGGGRQRAARAVEVALLTGRPLSWWQRAAPREGPVRPWFVRLSLPRAVLHQRIEARIQSMLAMGWVEEVEALLAAGVDPAAPGFDAVGYREVVQYLRGELPRHRLFPDIAAATRQYAKRQETWFRHQLDGDPVLTLDATEPSDRLAECVRAAWEQRGN